MELVKEFKTIGTFISLLGILPFLWYREKLTAPAFTACVVFVMLLQLSFILTTPWPKKIVWFGMLAGAILNQMAVWANGGMMPVKNGLPQHGIWRPMVESDRVKFLCDIYWNSTSIGDLIVFGSMILLLIFNLARVE